VVAGADVIYDPVGGDLGLQAFRTIAWRGRHLVIGFAAGTMQKDVLATPGDVRDRILGFSMTMFEHARDHIDLYRALVGGRGGAIALGTIRQILSDLVRNELARTVDKKSTDVVPREVVVQYIVGAFMAVMTWWLDGGAKLPPQRIDAMFRRLATEGIMRSYS
jgi:NADPH:quinone reductase-like Zn-dependent oxidoreductase